MPDFSPGRLSYGAANLGNLYGAMSDDEAAAVTQTAWECGMRYFDTAPHYGLGLSERRLGKFLAGKPRGEYLVSTKAGRLLRPTGETGDRLDEAHHFMVPANTERVWDFTAAGIRRSVEESLQRMGLDFFDIVYLHDPEAHDLDQAITEALPAMVELREEGVVGAVGVGSKSTKALLAGARSGAVDVLMVAGRFTLIEQPALDAVIPECRARSIAIANAAVYNSGLLAASNPTAEALYEYDPVPPDVLSHTRAIEAVCADFGVDLPTAALHYSLREATVRTVVVGGATPEQVRENSERMRAPVPDGLWDTLLAESLIRE